MTAAADAAGADLDRAQLEADGRTWRLASGGPVPRLERDAQLAYGANAARCWDDTGVPMAQFHRYAYVDGWQYVSDRHTDPQELEERRARQAERGDAWVDKGRSYYEAEIEPDLVAKLRAAARKKPRRDSLPALIDYLDASVDAYGYIGGDLHWRMAAGMKPPSWPDFYADFTGEPAINGSVFLQAIPNRTTRMVARLRDLARVVQSDTELAAVFERRDWPRLAELDNPSFRARLDVLLTHHGRRTGRGYGSNAVFTTPTWAMRPESVYDIIAGYAPLDLDELERMERDARAERHNAARRMRRRLAGDADRRAAFDRAYRKAIFAVCTMEDHNHLMEQETCGRLREAIDRLGRHLVADGHLDHPDDVFHVHTAELRTTPPPALRALVADRRAEVEAQSRLEVPGYLGPVPAGPPPVEEEAAEEGILRGEAASRGRYTGRARVVEQSPYPPELDPGDVLVARDAGPAWTPVFPVIGALVLDHGAGYQHAALVAREYRIPAVIGTRRATSTITDGQLVTVDGDTGVVLVSAGAQAALPA